MNYPPEECPRYDRCSVNLCPLDPDQGKRVAHEEDKEQKCPMEKRVRLRIGSKYPDLLPLAGLTTREHGAMARWSNLSAAQKQVIAERGRQALKARHSQPRQNDQNL